MPDKLALAFLVLFFAFQPAYASALTPGTYYLLSNAYMTEKDSNWSDYAKPLDLGEKVAVLKGKNRPAGLVAIRSDRWGEGHVDKEFLTTKKPEISRVKWASYVAALSRRKLLPEYSQIDVTAEPEKFIGKLFSVRWYGATPSVRSAHVKGRLDYLVKTRINKKKMTLYLSNPFLELVREAEGGGWSAVSKFSAVAIFKGNKQFVDELGNLFYYPFFEVIAAYNTYGIYKKEDRVAK